MLCSLQRGPLSALTDDARRRASRSTVNTTTLRNRPSTNDIVRDDPAVCQRGWPRSSPISRIGDAKIPFFTRGEAALHSLTQYTSHSLTASLTVTTGAEGAIVSVTETCTETTLAPPLDEVLL